MRHGKSKMQAGAPSGCPRLTPPAAAIARRALPAALGLALMLGGCATSTPYQPLSASSRVSGGYSEVRLASDRYRVTFAGNSFTARDRVEGYLLYRAAELTVEQGYDWFQIVERETEHHVEQRIEPDPLYHPWYGPAYGYWRPHWRYYDRMGGWMTWYPETGGPFWADGIDITTVERFEATAEIRMHKGTMPQAKRRAFDAREVMNRLGPTIERPQP